VRCFKADTLPVIENGSSKKGACDLALLTSMLEAVKIRYESLPPSLNSLEAMSKDCYTH